MARETNANGDNFPGSFLSDLAEILSIVHQDGNKMITDALFLGEITILKQVNNRLPEGQSHCRISGRRCAEFGHFFQRV